MAYHHAGFEYFTLVIVVSKGGLCHTGISKVKVSMPTYQKSSQPYLIVKLYLDNISHNVYS